MLLLVLLPVAVVADGTPAWLDVYRAPAARLIAEATRDNFAWERLAVLTDAIGARLSGSPQLDRAIAWAVAEMKRDGLDNVHTEKVMVPKWIRGNESAELVEPSRRALAMLGLGGSVATPRDGIEASVLVVHGFEELEAHAAKMRGRIVLLNVAFTSYGETVRYRQRGASRAARHGAAAVLVRSIGPDGLRLPHTGAVEYRGRRAAYSCRRDQQRRRRRARSHDRPWQSRDRTAADGGTRRAGRRVRQRGRRDQGA